MNFNVPLIAEVPGKQPSLYLEAEARTRERIGVKLFMKRAYLNIGQKSKSTVKANFVIGDDFFCPVMRLCREKQKGETFSPSCCPVSIRNSSLFFTGMLLQHRVALLLYQSW